MADNGGFWIPQVMVDIMCEQLLIIVVDLVFTILKLFYVIIHTFALHCVKLMFNKLQNTKLICSLMRPSVQMSAQYCALR